MVEVVRGADGEQGIQAHGLPAAAHLPGGDVVAADAPLEAHQVEDYRSTRSRNRSGAVEISKSVPTIGL